MNQVGLTEYDEIIPLALNWVFKSRSASVSLFQRKLRLGYTRAAEIIDLFEKLKIIGTYDPRQREVLISIEDYSLYDNIRSNLELRTNIN